MARHSGPALEEFTVKRHQARLHVAEDGMIFDERRPNPSRGTLYARSLQWAGSIWHGVRNAFQLSKGTGVAGGQRVKREPWRSADSLQETAGFNLAVLVMYSPRSGQVRWTRETVARQSYKPPARAWERVVGSCGTCEIASQWSPILQALGTTKQ